MQLRLRKRAGLSSCESVQDTLLREPHPPRSGLEAVTVCRNIKRILIFEITDLLRSLGFTDRYSCYRYILSENQRKTKTTRVSGSSSHELKSSHFELLDG